MFKDRKEAGRLLAKELQEYKNDKSAVVIAIPRGGVVPAFEIARNLHLPLDVALVKKIGHPTNREFAIGATSLNEYIINEGSNVTTSYIENEVATLRQKMRDQQQRFLGNRKPISLKNKKVIIVDDGIATGLTLKMVVELIKKADPAEIIVAVPVSPSDSAADFESLVDKFVCLSIPIYFRAVGEYYENFEQVEDETVKEILDQFVHI